MLIQITWQVGKNRVTQMKVREDLFPVVQSADINAIQRINCTPTNTNLSVGWRLIHWIELSAL